VARWEGNSLVQTVAVDESGKLSSRPMRESVNVLLQIERGDPVAVQAQVRHQAAVGQHDAAAG